MSRVIEVIAHIGYQADQFNEDDLIEIRDWTEALLGKEFQIAQDHVEMRLRSFGTLDEHDGPLFIRIIVDQATIDDTSFIDDIIRDQLMEHVQHYFGPDLDCRLWIEHTVAAFYEKEME